MQLTARNTIVRVPVRENGVQRNVRGLRPGERIVVEPIAGAPTVLVTHSGGESRRAAQIAQRLRTQLQLAVRVDARLGRTPEGVAVQPTTGDAVPLAGEIARLLGARDAGRRGPASSRAPRTWSWSSDVCDNVQTYAAS